MRCLTIRQPYASLIAEGIKHIETRSRRSPFHTAIGETIAIHAAVRVPRLPKYPGRGQRRVPNAAEIAVHDRNICWCGHEALMCLRHGLNTLPLGAVVATCRIVAVVPVIKYGALANGPHIAEFPDEGPLPHQRGGLWLIGQIAPGRSNPTRVEDQHPFGDFTPGNFALILEDVRKCVPFPAAEGRVCGVCLRTSQRT